MSKKKCTKCGKSKQESEFAFKNKSQGVRRACCKTCHNDYLRIHYQMKKEMYLENSKKQRNKAVANNMTRIMQYLQQHPCVDCGEKDPIVLEFDHVRGKKFKAVGSMTNRHPWHKIQKEIKKCDVRCANCHKRKTTKDHHWRKAAFLARGVIGNMPHSE